MESFSSEPGAGLERLDGPTYLGDEAGDVGATGAPKAGLPPLVHRLRDNKGEVGEVGGKGEEVPLGVGEPPNILAKSVDLGGGNGLGQFGVE